MIKGKLVELRAVERDDLPRYVEWLNDPDVMRWFAPYEPFSLDQEEAWYQAQLSNPSVRNFAVYYAGEHVGGAGYNGLDLRQRHSEVGLSSGARTSGGGASAPTPCPR